MEIFREVAPPIVNFRRVVKGQRLLPQEANCLTAGSERGDAPPAAIRGTKFGEKPAVPPEPLLLSPLGSSGGLLVSSKKTCPKEVKKG